MQSYLRLAYHVHISKASITPESKTVISNQMDPSFFSAKRAGLHCTLQHFMGGVPKRRRFFKMVRYWHKSLPFLSLSPYKERAFYKIFCDGILNHSECYI